MKEKKESFGTSFNLNIMKKADILKLWNNRCKEHSMRYLQHPNCYFKDEPSKIKKGYFDIETYAYGRAFKAENTVILSYCIKVHGEDKIYKQKNTPKEILKLSDKKIMKQMLKDLAKFNKIYTYYGTGFDLPAIRTRALANKLKFMGFGELFHKDVYYTVRSKLLLERSTQERAAKLILGRSLKTHYSPAVWASAFQGNTRCINKIHDHNVRDVLDLEKIQEEMCKYTQEYDRSV